MIELTPIQREIIEEKGNLIVQASAGTGKTQTMVEKIVNDVNENKTHKSIAAITFTIKAAQEIRDRLTVDIREHFIGTNNGFAIEEIIKPFMKDVFGNEFDIDMDTDYQIKKNSFDEAVAELRDSKVLCSYTDNKKNFIFELSLLILKKSKACQLYVKSKYFKIYVDEYQDCDKDMHDFFMYLNDTINIDFFIVGDDKQSIYMWRGAYPEAFKSILSKPKFAKKELRENFRSCQQIQNYSNLLVSDTQKYYVETDENENVIILKFNKNISWETILLELDSTQTFALLRFSNDNARQGAKHLTDNGFECLYIPTTPIDEITTNYSWFIYSIASYCIIEKYSIYDFLHSIPVESIDDRRQVTLVRKKMDLIKDECINRDVKKFKKNVENLANIYSLKILEKHYEDLYNTVINKEYHVAFMQNEKSSISLTFHSSKGLEFDQVLLFSQDYRLHDNSSIFNHYVASTRAKKKLVIIHDINEYNSKCFSNNITNIFRQKNIEVKDVVKIKDFQIDVSCF